jgi:hypothetical protein
MQLDKQTIKPLTSPSFLKNDEQTKQVGLSSYYKGLKQAYSPISESAYSRALKGCMSEARSPMPIA